jgi:CCR4-NOT transcriptional regulation complex NOT5 subunit
VEIFLPEVHRFNRNWRYHKKLKVWLTKDDMMVPQPLGNGTERGYYIFFDIKQWVRERVSRLCLISKCQANYLAAGVYTSLR